MYIYILKFDSQLRPRTIFIIFTNISSYVSVHVLKLKYSTFYYLNNKSCLVQL